MNQILDWRADGGGHDDAPDSAAALRREAYAKGSGVLDEEARNWLFNRG
jgi:hypothetical protein